MTSSVGDSNANMDSAAVTAGSAASVAGWLAAFNLHTSCAVIDINNKSVKERP